MHRNLQRLSSEIYDVLIIGGGVNGLAAAWDATLRGLKVALVEKGDFGAETSSATLKIVHGGLRYLQHLDFIRARESIRERSVMLGIAPHLVRPFPFIVPTYGHLMKGKEFMTAGIVMNEVVSFDRNRDLNDPARRIPAGRVLSRRECLEMVPCVESKGLTGGVLFYDAQMYNSERLTLAFALSAAEKGADLANHVEAVRLIREGDRVAGAHVRDRRGKSEFDIRAAVTANMTGPWSDITLGLIERPDPPRNVLRSKGIQIVIPPVSGEIGLAVASKYRDPDSFLSRGARHYFISPWRGMGMAGTTDTIYEGDPDRFRITGQDIRDFVQELNEALPSIRLARDQVPFAVGGMRPVTEKNVDKGAKTSRKYEVTDNWSDLRVDGLITVIGVKYTTCRFLAEKVVNLVFKKLGRAAPPALTHSIPLTGGNIERWDDFVRQNVQRPPAGLDQKVMQHLVCNYGTDFGRIAGLVKEDQGLGRLIPGSEEIVKAEVVHAVRDECALHLGDVVLRRTDLGTQGHPGREALEAVADLMAAELEWNASTRQKELDATDERYQFPD